VTLDAQHWQERLGKLAAEHGVVGASLAVELDGERLEAATGVLNMRSGQPATPDSVFQIGSISKVWTATLIMQLVDEGLLDLDAPVVTYLPDFRVADAEVTRTVTTRQLLTHTSGIDGDFFQDTGRGDDALEKYVGAMADLKQNHPQGATMSYCNSGYSVLGRIIEVLRGTTWDAALREHLLTPLGLETAGTLPEEALLYAAATGHVQQPEMPQPVVTPQWGIFRSAGPAGLIHCPARDVLVFARMHLDDGVGPDGKRVLSAESARAMREPQIEVPDRWLLGSHWGLGWILMTWDGQQVYGHDGATLGQGAFLRVLPERKLAVSLCCNGGRGMRELFEALYAELFQQLVGVQMPARPEPTGDTVGNAERFAGRYARESVQMDVEDAGNGKLQLTVTPTGPLALGAQPQVLALRPFEGEVLLAKAEKDESWIPAVFYDIDGSRFVHLGARATPRAGDVTA
jgi:CubicO group peptidase (beta-lactamase class C family)